MQILACTCNTAKDVHVSYKQLAYNTHTVCIQHMCRINEQFAGVRHAGIGRSSRENDVQVSELADLADLGKS